jgi:hypothetical protein
MMQTIYQFDFICERYEFPRKFKMEIQNENELKIKFLFGFKCCNLNSEFATKCEMYRPMRLKVCLVQRMKPNDSQVHSHLRCCTLCGSYECLEPWLANKYQIRLSGHH